MCGPSIYVCEVKQTKLCYRRGGVVVDTHQKQDAGSQIVCTIIYFPCPSGTNMKQQATPWSAYL